MSELQITVERNQGGLFQRAIGRFGVAIVVVPKIGSGAGSPFVLLPGERIKESLLEKSHHYDVYVIPADNYAEMFRAEGTLANSIKCTFKGTVYYRLNIAVPKIRLAEFWRNYSHRA